MPDITSFISDLAHNLGLKVVAEGIKNQAILDLLISLGCDGSQGYYYSRPLPPDKFIDWVNEVNL